MAIVSITKWLDDPKRTYREGLMLYEQYGDNKALLTLLRAGSGSYHSNKLKAALADINSKPAIQPKQIVFTEPVGGWRRKDDMSAITAQPISGPFKTADANSKQAVDLAEAPDKIQHIREEKTRRYSIARRLFETIRFMDSPEHRLQAGLELLDHMDYVNEAWAVIDEWAKDGQIRDIEEKKVEKEVESLSLPELMREDKNLPTYISKAKGNLEAAETPTKQAHFAARMSKLENRLEKVRKRLKDAIQ